MNIISDCVRNRLTRILHKKTDVEKAVASAAERLHHEPHLFSCDCEGIAAIQLYQYLLQGVSPFEGFCTECEISLGPDEYEVKHKTHIETIYGGVNIVVEDLFVCTCKKCGEIVDVPFFAKLNQINFDLGYNAALQEK